MTPAHLGSDEYDIATQGLVSHHYWVENGQLGVLSPPFRYVWPSELDLMARLAGLTLRERLSGWRHEPFTQTDQESRSAGPRAATSVTAMDITIHASFLPHDDPDASLAFCDTVGFEVRNDVAYGGLRWITVGPAGQPGTSISGLPVRL